MKRSKQKKSRKNFFIIILLSFIFLIGIVINFVFVKSIWSGKQRINFVLIGEKTALVSYSPDKEELSLVVIPDKLLLDVPRGYREYTVQVIPRLAEIEKRNNLLSETIQENFGLPIDGWIKNSNNNAFTNFEPKTLVANFLLEAIKRKGTSNLPLWDLIRLLKAVEAVKINHFNTIDLLSANAVNEVKLPDQSMAYRLVIEKIDLIIQRYFRLDSLRQENFTVQIFNGTSSSGLAQKAGRILFNIGINVVDINNTKDGWEKCEVKSRKAIKNSQTILNIIKIFDCGWVGFEEEQRADIILTIGKNYREKLDTK